MLKNENENDMKNIKNTLTSNPEPIVEEIKKSTLISKQDQLVLENKETNMKTISSNHIVEGTTGDDTKSKNSSSKKNNSKKKLDKKYDPNKIKKKHKISKFLKKERLKIPTGKRMSISNNTSKFNLNNIDKILLIPKQKSKTRVDKNGNKISKENKKNFHITFLDTLPSCKLIEIIPIQSYKKYNFIENMPDEQIISFCSKCCQIY
jgi:hypothetical protein